MITHILLSIASVFIALVLACAVWACHLRKPEPRRPSSPARRHFGFGPPPERPAFGRAARGYSRAELEAITRRTEARAAHDPMGLNRPLFFTSARSPSAGEADGRDPIQAGFPAVRTFRLVRGVSDDV